MLAKQSSLVGDVMLGIAATGVGTKTGAEVAALAIAGLMVIEIGNLGKCRL